MEKIQLAHALWEYDSAKPLGPEGGFGAVFEGQAEDGRQVAVKRLKISASNAAHREMDMAEFLHGQEFHNVLAVLDAGLDAGSSNYFLVMPKATGSLQAAIEQRGHIPLEESIEILDAIAAGLGEVAKIVHRDLKPANVLHHEGVWKIADFGIARFVEDSTSLRTLRDFLSAPFAAPEQWRLERATQATDLYSLGCIGFLLVEGKLPFLGPRPEDFKSQHLSVAPPELKNGPPQLRSLIHLLLRKVPATRPSRDRVRQILADLKGTTGSGENQPGLGTLAEAGVVLARKQSEEEAARATAEGEATRRHEVADAAQHVLASLIDTFFERVGSAVPSASRHKSGRRATIQAGDAKLVVSTLSAEIGTVFEKCHWSVVAGAVIQVLQGSPEYEWSASLWYADLGEGNGYRWYEVSYFDMPLLPQTQKFVPFALPPHKAADAAAVGMGLHQIAFGPHPVDDENSDDFMNRWADLFAQAIDGRLQHPSRLPL